MLARRRGGRGGQFRQTSTLHSTWPSSASTGRSRPLRSTKSSSTPSRRSRMRRARRGGKRATVSLRVRPTRVCRSRLAVRALAGALAAEREEQPASPALVQRLFTWLCAQVDKLLQRLGVVKPVTQQPAPASGAAQPAQPVSAAPATPGAGTPSRSTAGRPAALAADKPGHPHVATGHRSDAEKARWKAVSDREFAICSIPGGEERLLAEESKIRGGSSRPLSLEERESVASTVVAWIREGVRVDVDHVIGETCTEVGFTPPVQVWWAVGHQLQGGYVPDTRPGLLVSTLKTLLERTGAAPTDEEQTLRAALDEQRRAKAEERYQKALDVYRPGSAGLEGQRRLAQASRLVEAEETAEAGAGPALSGADREVQTEPDLQDDELRARADRTDVRSARARPTSTAR